MDKFQELEAILFDSLLKTLIETKAEDRAELSWFCTEEENFSVERQAA